ncbi:MAG: glycosyltransferase family 4 protein [Bacteroidia bacterium]
MKKIIIVGPAFPYRGGPARFNESLCAALVQQGIKAEIVSFTLQYPSLLFPGTTQYENKGEKSFPFKITRLINTVNPLSWIKTARYIKSQKPDGIIFRYWMPFFAPAFGSIARQVRKQTKIIALTDNVIPHEKRFGDRFLNGYFLSVCDGFLCMSEKVLKDLSMFTNNPNKIILHHPLYENYLPAIPKDEARQQLQLPLEEKILLFFGLVRAYKGLDTLLNALADETLKNYSFKVLIAGEFYDDKEYYLNIIRERKLEDKIILHDYYIPDDKVNVYFSACDAVVQPYKSATNSGVSMVSYFYDKPIISTNVGGLKEVVKDGQTGWLCEPDSRGIAIGIQKFLNCRDIATIEENIRLYKKEFSWETFAKKLDQFIISVKK